MALLQLDQVTKTFHPGEVNETLAVDRVSMEVEEGGFVAILGGNGSGKSTLLNLISGAYSTDRGRIVLDGADLTGQPQHKRAAIIGRVFQDPLMGTAAGLTIEENFALAARRGKFRGLGLSLGSKLRKEIRERLSILGMGLEDRLKSKVSLLSGGQRQAMTLLMAVFQKPKALLLDEHTAALDPRTSRFVMDLTRTIAREQAGATVMVTHNLAHALEVGSRVIILNRGRIAAVLDRDQLSKMNVKDLMDVFLETQRSGANGDEGSFGELPT